MIYLDNEFLNLFNLPNIPYEYETLKKKLEILCDKNNDIILNKKQFNYIKKLELNLIKAEPILNKPVKIRLKVLVFTIYRFLSKNVVTNYDPFSIFIPMDFI